MSNNVDSTDYGVRIGNIMRLSWIPVSMLKRSILIARNYEVLWDYLNKSQPTFQHRLNHRAYLPILLFYAYDL